MRIRWEEGSEISASVHESEITVSSNRAGLLSLANILADLANEEPGTHIHLDEGNSLEEGSAELIIEKVE
ncbi:MAG: hypothetical protein J6D54_02250 [Olsenella sp.]|nr:hypothetical protein [Olsenella sp.]